MINNSIKVVNFGHKIAILQKKQKFDANSFYRFKNYSFKYFNFQFMTRKLKLENTCTYPVII